MGAVLIVDPDGHTCEALGALLRGCQIDASTLADVSLLTARVTEAPPAMIVLRVAHAAVDAHAVLGALRAAGHDMPVLVLSRSRDVVDKVVALEIGADDYLVDPFEPMELVARVRSALRRYRARRPPVPRPDTRPSYTFGGIAVDFENRRATRAGRDLGLRDSEFALLDVFVSRPMCVLSRSEILALLGPRAAAKSERGLDVLVFRLRGLIENAVGGYRYIRTVRGKGYMFVPLGTLTDDDVR
ncbi:response regulator transcription factor [Burkholderia multivorans]|uniref:response regulator transcription factor n=1 Tax=Burkholderia multivorans TaxID=87883 RepID=UPI001C244B74|nr:response regulator transcription factor [Burkholderia multivorans]MBU9665997.1 response regulator transcription factor [Burkholderia multivorans]